MIVYTSGQIDHQRARRQITRSDEARRVHGRVKCSEEGGRRTRRIQDRRALAFVLGASCASSRCGGPATASGAFILCSCADEIIERRALGPSPLQSNTSSSAHVMQARRACCSALVIVGRARASPTVGSDHVRLGNTHEGNPHCGRVAREALHVPAGQLRGWASRGRAYRAQVAAQPRGTTSRSNRNRAERTP